MSVMAVPRAEKMKAIVPVSGSPGGIGLREMPKPVAGEDGVLVRVRAASINAADWHLSHAVPRLVGGLLGMGKSPAFGMDLAGEVEAVGGKVTQFKPGDEVFGAARGACAEYAAAREDRLAPKPRGLTFEQAAAIPVAGLTALQGLRDKAQVRSGQSVLINGAGGGVGTFAVQVARWLGAQVTAVTRTEYLDLVRGLGADEVVDYTREDFTRRGKRYDVLFDIGANRSSADYRRVLAPDGKLVLAGAPSSYWVAISRLFVALLRPGGGGRRIVLLARVNQPDLLALKELAEQGALTTVIDREVPLSDVPAAIQYLGTRRVRGKIVVHVA